MIESHDRLGERTPLSPAPALPEALLHTFLRASSLLRQVQEPYFARFGISPSQWGVLRVLQRAELKGEGELPLKVVSERLLVQPPSVTGVVNGLERLGLVKRSLMRGDLRVRHLSLTQEGRALLVRVLEAHAERIASLFAAISPAGQEALLALLQQFEGHLRSLVVLPTQRGRAARTTVDGLPHRSRISRNQHRNRPPKSYGSPQ
jgi:DNA-binding MarR family transcriptional regulator